MKKAGKTIIAVCLSLMCVCFSFFTVPSSFNMATVSAAAYSTEPSSYATIKKGSQGYSVKAMQTMLNAVTGAGLSVDGIFGTASYNALCSYQRAERLTVDGICGKDTWTALCSAYGAGASRSIANGTYTVASSLNSNRVIDCIHSSKEDDANVILYDNAETDNQHIQITFLGNGYYSIVFVHSGKSIDMNRETHNVTQWGYHGGKNQQWAIFKYGEQYAIVNRESGLYLDLQAGNPINEANIQVYKGNNTKAQRWILTSVCNNYARDVYEQAIIKLAYDSQGATYRLYASKGVDWCAYYATSIVRQALVSAGYSESLCASDGSTTSIANSFNKIGKHYSYYSWEYIDRKVVANISNNFSPKVGDIVAVENNGTLNDGPDHTGLIVEVGADYIICSEGNTGTGSTATRVVKYHTYYKSDKGYIRSDSSNIYITGFSRPID